MATKAVGQKVERAVPQTQVIGGSRFDWIMVGIGTWLMIGAYSDGWAHNHLPLDNFFTPWHGAFYSGFLVAGVFLIGNFVRNRARGYPAYHAMPEGYELSLIGAIIIFFGGIGDMFWHILFGIELNIDGLLSPTHIAVLLGLALVVSGPFRAFWHRTNGQTDFLTLLPMLLSLTYLLSCITIVTQLFHPFVHTLASTYGQQDVAVASIVLQNVILMSLVLLTIRRWRLPFGSFTLVFTLNMIFLSFMQDHYLFIPVVALAGVATDLLYLKLQPRPEEPGSIRLFAFLVPVILYLLYFGTLELTSGVTWTIHLWLGSTFVSGLTGFLLSYLLLPPHIPAEQEK